MTSLLLSIDDQSQVSQARREATFIARDIGFDQNGAANISIIVTEAATNLIKHGRGGQLVIRPSNRGGRSGIELIAFDSGPGIDDVARAMRDGFSTSGSSGTGMGAIARLSDDIEVYTLPSSGTVLVARIWRPGGPDTEPTNRMRFDGFSVPKQGETVCGDAWIFHHDNDRSFVMVCDGLGHGPMAAQAAQAALETFRESTRTSPGDILDELHGGMRHTRGAAIAVAEVRQREGKLIYAGIGNIVGSIVRPNEMRRLVSHNGTVGMTVRKVQEFTYDLPDDAFLILHSDGISTHWKLEDYPGLLDRSTSLIATVLYRDFCRGRDDATVVVGGRN